MTPRAQVFGVRHLSPMGAWQLRRFLDEIRPKLVLIEGLADATALIPDIVRRETAPPIAILAYTDDQPVRTLVYPFARYSPEYQALVWAKANRREARFFDLPSDIFLALPDAWTAAANDDDEPEIADRGAIYERFARDHGESDYDTFWERHFEHNLANEAYRRAAFSLGEGLREMEDDPPLWRAENLVREAFMRRELQRAMDGDGLKPEEIVCVVGAFHAPGSGPCRKSADDGRGAGKNRSPA